MKKEIKWVTLTNKHDMKVSVRIERIAMITEIEKTSDMVSGDCVALVECSDGIKVPVKETREEVISLTDAAEMLMERTESGKHRR